MEIRRNRAADNAQPVECRPPIDQRSNSPGAFAGCQHNNTALLFDVTKKSKEEALRKMGKKKKKSGSSGHFGHKTPRKMDACSESAASSTVQQTKASAGNNKTFGGRATDRGNVFLFSQLSKDCELVCSVATSATQQKMLFHPTPGKSLHALFLSSFSCRAMSAVFCSHSVHLFHLKQTAGTNNGSSS